MWLEVLGGHKLLNTHLISGIEFCLVPEGGEIKFFGPDGRELWVECYPRDIMESFEDRQTRLREILRAERCE